MTVKARCFKCYGRGSLNPYPTSDHEGFISCPVCGGTGENNPHTFIKALATLICSRESIAPRTLKGTRYAIEQWGLVPLWGNAYGNWFARLACDDTYITVILNNEIADFDIEYGALQDVIHTLPDEAFNELLAIPSALTVFFRGGVTS